jgi:hypothetical protein
LSAVLRVDEEKEEKGLSKGKAMNRTVSVEMPDPPRTRKNEGFKP